LLDSKGTDLKFNSISDIVNQNTSGTGEEKFYVRKFIPMTILDKTIILTGPLYC